METNHPVSMKEGENMYTNNSEDTIIQNLKDAGCDAETIESFLSDLQRGDEKSSLKRLRIHRKKLLDSLHKEQKCIDCLDYLVYRMSETNK